VARSQTSSLWLLLWGGFVFLAFHPVPAVEHALDLALSPLRASAELGAPFRALRRRSVDAAEHTLAEHARAEAAEGLDTLARLAERALPKDPALRAARAFVPATVIARASEDECWVEFAGEASVLPGAPVVCGDAFVGRVIERSEHRAAARVRLLTHELFRIGAEVRPAAAGGEPVFLTVGGVRARPRRGHENVRLAVHQPSSSTLSEGLATVHELFADAEASAALAEGFVLGRVRRDGARSSPWLAPELDFAAGLFQVAIVLSPGAGTSAREGLVSPLEDGHWLATRALSFGEPSPWRSALKIPLAASDGVRVGAAVTGVGAQLVGRVLAVGTTTSSVALLGDPGFSVAAIARPAGSEEPQILGRLTTLGRGREGSVRLRWIVRLPVTLESAGGPVEARLFTGSGDPGLPGGLFLGTTLLPRDATVGEERELLLQPRFEPSAVERLFVRRGEESP
jgi:cell shape-determining protein MreC